MASLESEIPKLRTNARLYLLSNFRDSILLILVVGATIPCVLLIEVKLIHGEKGDMVH